MFASFAFDIVLAAETPQLLLSFSIEILEEDQNFQHCFVLVGCAEIYGLFYIHLTFSASMVLKVWLWV